MFCKHAHHRTRTYDLSITYDKYYQTPRLWQACDIEIMMAGYDVKWDTRCDNFIGNHSRGIACWYNYTSITHSVLNDNIL